jgi:hypothetical protein
MKKLLSLIASLSLVAVAQLASASTIVHGVDGTYTYFNGTGVADSSDFDRAEFTFASEYVDTITVANFGIGYAHDHGTNYTSDLQVFNGTNWITVLSISAGNDTPLSDMFSNPVTFAGMNITGMRLDSSGDVGNMYHQVNSSMTYELAGTPSSNVPEPTSIALMGLGIAGIATLRRRKAA